MPGLRTIVCPGGRADRSASGEDIENSEDLSAACDHSYHLQYQPRAIRIRVVAKPFVMPYASDTNPMFEGGSFNEDVDPETANSTSHRGRGQNVVHFDGHVGWYIRPVLGNGDDNMWQIGRLRRYSGTETPSAVTDAFMAP